MTETTIYRFSNSGNSLGVLPYVSATHDEDLDGTDKLTVRTDQMVSKRERLVWRDAGGVWHEHMVDSLRGDHTVGRQSVQITCSNSVSALFGVPAQGTVLTGTVGQILSTILANTGWSAGICSGFGIVEMEVWHKSVRECIAQLCEEVHGELYTMIEVGENGVTTRRLGIVRELGSSTVTRQFRYGRNVTGVKREVGSEEVYTACIGYGAKVNGEEDSPYADRLSTVVYSDANLDLWGVQMSNGEMGHNFMSYTDEQCTDMSFLNRQCERQMEVFSNPLVRYEFEAIETDGMWSDIRLGNRVSCVDDDFEPPIEMIERVSHIRRDLRGRDTCVIAIGKRVNPITERFKAQEKGERRTTGNSSRSNADRPVRTEGGSTYSGGGSGGGSGSSDGWVHQIDGVTQETGTINFLTETDVDNKKNDQTTPSNWGSSGNPSSGWPFNDSDPEGGGGGFSGGGGAGWGGSGGGGAF